jgi:hypothetical protein
LYNATASSFAKSLVIPKVKQFVRFSRLSAMTLWELVKLKNGITSLKIAELQLTLTSLPVGRQQAEIRMSLTKYAV